MSTGAITVYYEGTGDTTYAKDTALPTAIGTYAVTFDVAADTNWNAASGLSAGTLTISSMIEMVWVPAGSFQMGKDLGTAATGDIANAHMVTLTAGFYMGTYVVTQEQYEEVMGTNPSSFQTSVAGEDGTPGKLPVEMVSWYDALVFCNKLSMARGLSPAYRISGETDPAEWGTVPTSSNATWNAVEVVDGSTGYRLPTEAQWEYAAKGGDPDAAGWEGYTYAGSDTANDVSWNDTNSASKTHEVGKKAPNKLGIYDMSGNVWEWCWDWYGAYTNTAKTNPTGASSGSFRVRRGGHWGSSAEFVRSAYRYYSSPYSRNNYFGFRLVRQ
jgi:formylglycine-generating enzyme required for sulfatase activity